MLLDDPIGNVKEFIQPIRTRGTDSEDQEPASLLKIWDPIQTQNHKVKTIEISQTLKSRSGTGQHYGRIPEDRIERSTDTTKSCLRSVANPIERERLTCSGRGAARSLVNREWRLRPSGGTLSRRAVITADSDACSAVDGNPRPCQRWTHRLPAEEPRNNSKTYTRCRDAWANCPRHEGSPSYARHASWGRRSY